MHKNYLIIFSFLFAILFIACSNDKRDVSASEFINDILPEVEVKQVLVENMEKILIQTAGSETYSININSMDRMETEAFLNRIRMETNEIPVSYQSTPSPTAYIFELLSLLPLISLFLILIHIILLWIALKRIIKSEIDNIEKLVYTIISIFFPFFGPIIYFTAGRKRLP